MIPVDPGPRASERAGDAFYGLSHFAVDCLAQKYGQDRMFRFVRLVLVRDEPYGVAALDAFGVSFHKIDEACVAWIRKQVSEHTPYPALYSRVRASTTVAARVKPAAATNTSPGRPNDNDHANTAPALTGTAIPAIAAVAVRAP